MRTFCVVTHATLLLQAQRTLLIGLLGENVFKKKKTNKIAAAGNRLPKHKLLGPALPVTCLQRQQITHSKFWSFFSKD